jgi:hypothetical protein
MNTIGMSPCMNETLPARASGCPSVVSRGSRTARARWMVAVILGYLALSPLVGLALAAEFDAPQPPAVAVDHATGRTDPPEVIVDDVPRIIVPPGPTRLRFRDLSATEATRRDRWRSIPR